MKTVAKISIFTFLLFSYNLSAQNLCGDSSRSFIIPVESTNTPFDIDGANTLTKDCSKNENIAIIKIEQEGIIHENFKILQVAFMLNHENPGDLIITLISPSGTEMLLSNHKGGNDSKSFSNARFMDTGIDLSSTTPPFSGLLIMPEEGLLNEKFMGEPVKGEWIVKFCDNSLTHSGTVEMAGLVFCSGGKQKVMNDNPENAMNIGLVKFPFTIKNVNFILANNSNIPESVVGGCRGSFPNTVWYKYTAKKNGIITTNISWDSIGEYSNIFYFEGNNSTINTMSQLKIIPSQYCAGTNNNSINVEKGKHYYIMVSNYDKNSDIHFNFK